MMKFIDTHAHLYDEAFDGDFDETIARIKGNGVVKCIFPAIDSTTFARQREELDFVFQEVERGGYVAIGEIGMDGYWSKEFLPQQKEVFAWQLKLAYRKGLPVIIHAREATDEIFQVLDSLGGEVPRGVFHAFSGSWETYQRICGYGNFMVGIGGVATYKNAGVAKTLEKIPLERIVLETDSPYLTPVPFRGKRNESSYLVYIAEKISQIKGCTLEEVADATVANAIKMFGLQ